MKNNDFLQKLLNKKTKDYSFTIVFFVIFSFFVFFVIKPNLTTVFSLQTQLEELKKLDKDYEAAIINVVSIQSALEKNRNTFPLLSAAIPSTPQVNQIVDDIRKVATDSSIQIRRMDITAVNLKENKNKNNLKNYSISMELNSDFVQFNKFLVGLIQNRRLKSLKTLSVVKDTKQGSESASLTIRMEIEGFYL